MRHFRSPRCITTCSSLTSTCSSAVEARGSAGGKLGVRATAEFATSSRSRLVFALGG